jgi:site-specific DNA recombinase
MMGNVRDPIGRHAEALQAQFHPGEHTPIVDQPLWDAVQTQLASNVAERNSGTRNHQPSLLAGMLFDGDGNRMTPSHAVKMGTHYRYYVSSSLITKDRTETYGGQAAPVTPPQPRRRKTN